MCAVCAVYVVWVCGVCVQCAAAAAACTCCECEWRNAGVGGAHHNQQDVLGVDLGIGKPAGAQAGAAKSEVSVLAIFPPHIQLYPIAITNNPSDKIDSIAQLTITHI